MLLLPMCMPSLLPPLAATLANLAVPWPRAVHQVTAATAPSDLYHYRIYSARTREWSHVYEKICTSPMPKPWWDPCPSAALATVTTAAVPSAFKSPNPYGSKVLTHFMMLHFLKCFTVHPCLLTHICNFATLHRIHKQNSIAEIQTVFNCDTMRYHPPAHHLNNQVLFFHFF